MTDCLFCDIAAKELDATIVFESDRVLGFEDINPAAPTHVLAIPKEHIESAGALDASHAQLLGEIFESLARFATERGLSGGYRVVANSGSDAGQEVPHLHFHLLGGRAMKWPPG